MRGLKNNMFQVRQSPEFEFKDKLPYIIYAISVPREEKGMAYKALKSLIFLKGLFTKKKKDCKNSHELQI
jgi:hypothetical protein